MQIKTAVRTNKESKACSISEFVEQNIGLIEREDERSLLLEFAKSYSDLILSEEFQRPFVINKSLEDQDFSDFEFRVSGRGVFLPEKHIKIIGCRPPRIPLEKNKKYPNGNLLFTNQLPFFEYCWVLDPEGTHEPEGILRRILGFAFCQKNGIETVRIPLGVWHYISHAETIGYAFIAEQQTDQRVTDLQGFHLLNKSQYVPLALSEEFWAKKEKIMLEYKTAVQIYKSTKEKLLNLFFSFHKKNGFIGISNAHLENIVVSEATPYMVDLETFHLRDNPTNGRKELREHFMSSLAEILEICPLILFDQEILETEHFDVRHVLTVNEYYKEYTNKLKDFYKSLGVKTKYITQLKEDVNDFIYWLAQEIFFGNTGVYLGTENNTPSIVYVGDYIKTQNASEKVKKAFKEAYNQHYG